MDTAPRSAAAALIPSGDLAGHSLYQTVPLLLAELQRRHPDLDEESLHRHLGFSAHPARAFPASDIAHLEDRGELGLRLHLNLLGLSGAASPLPDFYADQALGDRPANAVRDFLDLFNDRLQRLLYPAWRKYRYHASFTRQARDPLSGRLLALAGLPREPLDGTIGLDSRRLLPQLGLLGLRAHSAPLIETVLRHYFGHADLQLEACVERRVGIAADQRSHLGQSNQRLGDTLVLGTCRRDRSGKCRLHLRQLSWSRLHDFLPRGRLRQPLHALLQLLLRDPLEHDLQLQLCHDQIRALRLSIDNPCRLGWTTWLGHQHADGITLLGPLTDKDEPSCSTSTCSA